MQLDNENNTFLTPDQADTTWEEIGFAEFPLVVTSLKRPPFDTLEFVEEIGFDQVGEPVNRTWKMVGSAEYGLPRLPDLDVFMAILKLLERHGYRERRVYCTLKDICDVAGLQPGGTTYKRIKDAFLRFATTTYVAERVFRDRTTKETVQLETWDIIHETRFSDDSERERSYFEVGKRFLKRLQTGQLKPIDLTLWRELPLGLEKPIYHYLDKNLHGRKGRHEIGLKKLCERIALTGKYRPYDLQRLLTKPLSNLVNVSFLSQFSFERSKSRRDPMKLVVFPGPRARGERKSTRMVVSHPQTPNRAPARRITQPTPTVASEAEALVRRFRQNMNSMAEGAIGPNELGKAADLLIEAGSYELALYTVDYACSQAKQTGFNVQNFAGLLINDYPSRARAAFEAEQKDRIFREQEARRVEQEAAYLTWREREEEKLWNELAAAERDQLVAKARSELMASGGTGIRLWTEDAIARHAERRARSRLPRNLPSIKDWLGSQPSHSPD